MPTDQRPASSNPEVYERWLGGALVLGLMLSWHKHAATAWIICPSEQSSFLDQNYALPSMFPMYPSALLMHN